jgi:Ca2+-binding RTX toxin-like protein
VGPVDLGVGRTAVAITAGDAHTCALLDTGAVRCWGAGDNGRLGYANTNSVGDNETPGSVGPLALAGQLVAQVADVSLAAVVSVTSSVVGGDVAFTVSARNDGPDASVAPLLLVQTVGSPTLVSQVASQGAFDPASGVWQPGMVAAGQTATLTVVERATTSGSLTVAAELNVAPTRDPDSRPGNFAPLEDDRAAATVTVSASPSAPPAPQPPPPSPGSTALSNADMAALLAALNLTAAAGKGPGGSLVPRRDCTITGTPGRDTLVGTAGNDVICGLAGNDTVRGLGGRDLVDGGAGNDVLEGQGGDDVLLGLAGRDALRGGNGKDRLNPGNGRDTADGGPGRDTLLGLAGRDTLVGIERR